MGDIVVFPVSKARLEYMHLLLPIQLNVQNIIIVVVSSSKRKLWAAVYIVFVITVKS